MSPQTHLGTAEFPSPEPVAANVRLGGGLVTATAEDRPVTVVTVEPYDGSEASRRAADQTTVAFSDGRLRVETTPDDGPFRRSGRVRITLRLPLDSRLQVEAGSADVRTEGRLEEIVVTSGSGDTYVTEAGALRVDTGSGDVRADQIGGALRVATASGDVSVATARGEVVVKTASGDLKIDEARGEVRASTASGDVRIGAAHGGQVNVNSASGDAQIGVPTGTRVWLDLSTVSGSTTSDLAMEGAPTGQEGPALSLQVRTVSGDIAIRRVVTRTAM